MMHLSEHDIESAIVLTGTIIPNTTLHTKHTNIQKRKQDYLAALHFYSQFANVYFLENSSYPILEDDDFIKISNISIKKMPISLFSERGKGFQEFEMLDNWISNETNLPKAWIKITGRYLYPNFQEIWNECHRQPKTSLIVNQYRFSNWSDTSVFFVKSDYYKKNLIGLYNQCNDARRSFVENVFYSKVESLSSEEFKRFYSHLNCVGIAGHTGDKIQNRWIDFINSNIRDFNYFLDKRYIWLSL